MPFSLTDGSFVWCKLIALSDRVKLFDGGYGTLEEKKRNVSLAVVICTFKREEYVKSNVKSLCDFARRKEEDVTVYVIDNGQTLKSEDVEGALLFKNKNLGGSGGFTRGMIEAYRAQSIRMCCLWTTIFLFLPKLSRARCGFWSIPYLKTRRLAAVCSVRTSRMCFTNWADFGTGTDFTLSTTTWTFRKR